MIPARFPFLSTTGKPPILCCSINRNASRIEASGAMVITLEVMTSLAFIDDLLSLSGMVSPALI
jgi:hypothetical protein